MRRLWVLYVSLLSLTMFSCNYDDENSKKVEAVSPDTYIKNVSNEFFASDNLDTMDFKKVNSTIAYLYARYGTFPNASTGKVSLYSLLQHFKTIVGGDITALPTMLTGFKDEAGVYEANTTEGKWIKTATATDSIVLHFKDQNNQNREALMSWGYSLGFPLPLTLKRSSGVVTVGVPDRVTLQVKNLSSSNDSAMTVNVSAVVDAAMTTVVFTNKMTYLDYDFTGTVKITDTTFDFDGKLTKNGSFLASYVLNGIGKDHLKGFFDRVDYTLTPGSYESKLNILNELYFTDKVTDVSTLRTYLLTKNGTGEYQYTKDICDVINARMNLKVWNASNSLLCTATMYPVKMNNSYVVAPNVNWIYGDSQDLNDFSSDGVRNTVAHLQQILLYINNLLGNNSI